MDQREIAKEFGISRSYVQETKVRFNSIHPGSYLGVIIPNLVLSFTVIFIKTSRISCGIRGEKRLLSFESYSKRWKTPSRPPRRLFLSGNLY